MKRTANQAEIEQPLVWTRQEKKNSYILCLAAALHSPIIFGPFLIVTFYIISTPEKGWTVQDLGIVFALHSVGWMIAGSTLPLLSAFNAMHFKHLLHLIQFFLGGIVPYSLMIFGTMLDKPLWLFAIATFLTGITHPRFF